MDKILKEIEELQKAIENNKYLSHEDIIHCLDIIKLGNPKVNVNPEDCKDILNFMDTKITERVEEYKKTLLGVEKEKLQFEFNRELKDREEKLNKDHSDKVKELEESIDSLKDEIKEDKKRYESLEKKYRDLISSGCTKVLEMLHDKHKDYGKKLTVMQSYSDGLGFLRRSKKITVSTKEFFKVLEDKMIDHYFIEE